MSQYDIENQLHVSAIYYAKYVTGFIYTNKLCLGSLYLASDLLITLISGTCHNMIYKISYMFRLYIMRIMLTGFIYTNKLCLGSLYLASDSFITPITGTCHFM